MSCCCRRRVSATCCSARRAPPARRYEADLKAELVTEAGDLVIPGPGSPSRFLCAGFSYDNELAHPLLSLLPPVLHVSAAHGGPGRPLNRTLRLLMGELSRHQIGSEAAVERLIEVLFVPVIRSWLETTADSTPPSWLTGLRDAVVARALGLLHSEPDRASNRLAASPIASATPPSLPSRAPSRSTAANRRAGTESGSRALSPPDTGGLGSVKQPLSPRLCAAPRSR